MGRLVNVRQNGNILDLLNEMIKVVNDSIIKAQAKCSEWHRINHERYVAAKPWALYQRNQAAARESRFKVSAHTLSLLLSPFLSLYRLGIAKSCIL